MPAVMLFLHCFPQGRLAIRLLEPASAVVSRSLALRITAWSAFVRILVSYQPHHLLPRSCQLDKTIHILLPVKSRRLSSPCIAHVFIKLAVVLRCPSLLSPTPRYHSHLLLCNLWSLGLAIGLGKVDSCTTLLHPPHPYGFIFLINLVPCIWC